MLSKSKGKLIYVFDFIGLEGKINILDLDLDADLGRGMGKKGWIREKPALDTIQSDFLMDGYPPLENRDGFGGL